MKNSKVSSRYAQAFLNLSLEQDFLERAREDMQLILQVFLANRDFRLMLNNPVISPIKKAGVLRALFQERLHRGSMLFLTLLASNRREMHIGAIADAFISLYNIHKNIRTVYLKSASPLSEETKTRIKDMVRKKFDCQVVLEEQIDPNLIGGFTLKVDDYLFDTSITAELNQFRKHFQENAYKRGI